MTTKSSVTHPAFAAAWKEEIDLQRDYNERMNRRLESGLYGETMAKETEVKEKKPKKEGPKFEGMALYLDIMKKMVQQVGRLPPGADGAQMILECVSKALNDKRNEPLQATAPPAPKQSELFP